MNGFLGVCLYFLIGTSFAVLADNEYRDKCGQALPTDAAIFVTVGWVGVIPVELLSDYESTGEYCENVENSHD